MDDHDTEVGGMDYAEDDDRSYLPNPFKIIWHALIGIKRIISIGCTLIILFIIVAIVTIIFRPHFLWKPTKSFLNNNLAITAEPQKPKITYPETIISETEFAYLIQQKIGIDNQVITSIDSESILVYVNIDDESEPLWAKIEVVINTGQNVEIKNIGFARFDLPQFITRRIDSAIVEVLDVFNREDLKSIMEEILGENTDIIDVRIVENTIVIEQ